MKIHHLTPEEALRSLHSGPDGLSPEEARGRLQEFGPNRVEKVERTSLAVRFARGFTHFFALILAVAAGLAFVAEWADPGGGMATLGLAILGVIAVNGVFSFWQEYRAERALQALQELLPHQVTALRAGKAQPIPAEELVPGDVILLDDGEDIPADCRVLQAFGLRVNNATVTGESLPQARHERPSEEEDLLHGRNTLLAGTSVVAGQARALVFATGMHTEFGQIAHLTQHARETLSPLQKEIVRLSHLVGLLSLFLGVVFYLIGRLLGLSFWENFLFAIGIIVANVPEGLLPTVTLALAMASQRMARRRALIRHLPSVETLGSATVICTDKTGTLTENRMAVRRLWLGGRSHDWPEDQAGLRDDYPRFFETAFACQALREIEGARGRALRGDPMEVALRHLAEDVLPGWSVPPQVDEVPFDSDRRRLSTLHRVPQGLVLYTKGALEALLPLCRHVQAGAKVQELTAAWREQLLHAQDAMAEAGLRVLAFAHRAVPEGTAHEHLEQELILTGLVGLEDPPRPEVPDAVRRCREAGIQVVMITGDHPRTATAVARRIGLVDSDCPVVLTGEVLRRLSNIQLQLALNAPDILFARVGADQKMRIVKALQAKKHIVAVTGDGVNDAPALRKADIGIAMGRTGTDVAREAADMVLLDDNFASIVAAIEEGRTVFANMRKFLTYILTHNVAELIPYLAFVLFRIPLPLTVLQILAIDLGTDTLPALALGAERPDPDTMRRPPRSRRERLLNGPLLLRAYLFLGILEGAGALAAFFFMLRSGGWSLGQALAADNLLYLEATTACLSAIIVMQVANVLLCRSESASAFASSLRSNPLIVAGVVTEIVLILLIDYTRPGQLLFGTASLPARVWLVMLLAAFVLFLLEEGRKALVRRTAGRRLSADAAPRSRLGPRLFGLKRAGSRGEITTR